MIIGIVILFIVNLFSAWLKGRQVGSHICFCIQSIGIFVFIDV